MTTTDTTAHRSNITLATGFDSLTENWQETLVSGCVTPFEVERAKKILAREYKPAGKFPIIDQGQQLVAGYTDDESAVVREGLPLLVFGDHTRVFKFVDFPFVVGADGTKLLKPIAELDPKFFYFACLNLDIPTRGYNRHFKILREQTIRYPKKSEQEKIAAVLWKIQKAVEIEDAIVRNARDLKKSLLRRLFTHGLRGEPLKETEIGPLPQGWDVVPLGDIARIGNGSTPKRDNTAYWHKGTIPWLTSAKVYDRVIRDADQFVTDVAIRECHLPRVKPGSLLIAITGQGKTLGNAAITAIETTISQHLAFAQFKRTDIEPNFIRFFFDGQYEYLRQVASGGGSTKGALTCGFLKSFLVPLTTPDEQREIAHMLQTVDHKVDIHESKKRSLQDLFKTTLHKLMTAQIRVNDLDIDTSEVRQ